MLGRRVGTIGCVIGCVIVCVIVALLALTQILFTAATVAAEHTGHKIVIITGGSMEPSLAVGDALLLDTTPRTWKVGDTGTFRSPTGVLTTHRIKSFHRIDKMLYARTQGDANPDPDPNFTPISAFIGTPDRVIPKGGYLATHLLSASGRLLTFGPLLLLVVFFEAKTIRVRWRAAAPHTTPAPCPI